MEDTPFVRVTEVFEVSQITGLCLRENTYIQVREQVLHNITFV